MILHGLRIGLASLALAVPQSVQAEGGLQPYQVVRSLELVQDRIASGDQAALPMQRKLLEMADANFRKIAGPELDDALNRRALLVYAMSGGNPATIRTVLSRMPEKDPERILGRSIVYYLEGQVDKAVKGFGPINPADYKPELGAYLALVKGSVLSNDQPEAAVRLLDYARLVAPGTLVEEAALRRSVALSTSLKDPDRFIRASAQYVRSYLRSPYASQFADAFVAGVVALHTRLDLEEVSEIVAMMDPEREKVIYLRIARRAAIDGLTELSAFAAGKAAANTDDPRALLYSGLSSVAVDTVDDVLKKLATIDRSKLSENDRQLLDAAQAVAKEMVAKPVVAEAPAPVEPPAAQEAPASNEAGEDLVVYGDPEPSPPSGETAAQPMPLEAAAPAEDAAPLAPAPVDAAEATMMQARKQLADIDKLLGAAVE